MTSPDRIRSENDRRLFDALLANREVQRAQVRLEQQAERGPPRIRRQLLGTSVRLTSAMAPVVHATTDQCAELLGIETELELFVYASPKFNAACFKPEDGRVFVIFASSLIEAFDESELRFVIGHELAHHLYRHHDIPIGFILGGKSSANPRLALDLYAWSRYAEISADRAGAWCAQDFESTARALFKLASGLSGERLKFRLDDFLSQVDEMQIESDQESGDRPLQDWFSTHPFSPLRVKALELFHDSELVRDGGMSVRDLEHAVHALMGLMEPSYLEGHTEAAEAMRRLLFAGTIAIAAADGEISEKEIAIFEKFFGKGTFNDNLDVETLKQSLDERVAVCRSRTSVPQRMQILRDLCLVARAEASTGSEAQAVLDRIAVGLNVPKSLVAQSLECDVDVD